VSVDKAVAALAARQAGTFSVAQARDVGVTVAKQRSRVAAQRWFSPFRGVLAIAGTPNTPEQRLWAARLALPTDALVSCRAGLWVWDISGSDELNVLEFTVSWTSSVRRPGVVLHRVRDFAKVHPSRHKGFAVTTPMRTLMDVGAVLEINAVEDAVDRAVARKLVTPPALLAELERSARSGRDGCAALRHVLLEQGVGSNRSPSYLEAKALRLFRRNGLPEPRVELTWGSHGQFRLDFVWVEFGLVVEVDGWDCHSSHHARQYDFRRRNQIVLGSLRPLVYTYGDIVRGSANVIKEIREAMAATPAGFCVR
jgi:very-short-patch-repair endonuclease